jgi:hypothetical protein
MESKPELSKEDRQLAEIAQCIADLDGMELGFLNQPQWMKLFRPIAGSMLQTVRELHAKAEGNAADLKTQQMQIQSAHYFLRCLLGLRTLLRPNVTNGI